MLKFGKAKVLLKSFIEAKANSNYLIGYLDEDIA